METPRTYEAIILSDVHASEDSACICRRFVEFLSGVAPRARRLFILGDLFDFWFGPRQADIAPYGEILGALAALASSAEVTVFHGNRDFYLDAGIAGRFGFRLVAQSATETLCGRKALLCHGDMLCTNDVSYHRMRAVLESPAVEWLVTHSPTALARAMARFSRRRSKLAVTGKTQRVLGINEGALRASFAGGADVIVCGHTHVESTRTVETSAGPRTLYTLGDFGADGSYLVCDAGGFRFRRA